MRESALNLLMGGTPEDGENGGGGGTSSAPGEEPPRFSSIEPEAEELRRGGIGI
jgi:hypothetical protein